MEEKTVTVRDLDPDRLRLLRSKIGRLFVWKRPNVVASVGPYTPEVFERFDKNLQDLINKCRETLASYSNEQVAEILKAPRDGGAVAKEWANFLSNDVYYLEKRQPAWHAAGFGHPDHAADFIYWTKMPAFTVGELTCLSVGIGPTEFPELKLFELSRAKDRHNFSTQIEFLVLKFELFSRTFTFYGRNVVIPPGQFIEWADRFHEEVHPGFLEPLRTFHLKQEKASEVPVEKNHKREVDTIAQLFTAMAIDYLGYNPLQPRSPIPREIANLAATMGLKVTDETVRKYLRTGAKYIAPDWVPPKNKSLND